MNKPSKKVFEYKYFLYCTETEALSLYIDYTGVNRINRINRILAHGVDQEVNGRSTWEALRPYQSADMGCKLVDDFRRDQLCLTINLLYILGGSIIEFIFVICYCC